ncbi:MAG: heavy metal transporter [Hydrogenophilales bacterium CG17_big_fil_post_rev_8_21_14_2_50_63_12]|nr:MAG: heavy metal transporter [Hydrogenophilales bacterium CG17_big_fil_post_rev_8_21_14_2_50_63_12]PIX95891.1 MAG: heavy metal transporter [Hydrogenophilales bacterium CG_4_10_14_3_um_filter_63_21]PJB04257.1 MAG: heavy metal transporter [Hydrogenophilales bacterium CG_4_9_14_3_um_filter_63_34]
MNTLTLTVSGMSCMGCVNSVKNLVGALPGVSAVQVDLASGRVDVAHDPALATAEAIHAAIRSGGYQVVG